METRLIIDPKAGFGSSQIPCSETASAVRLALGREVARVVVSPGVSLPSGNGATSARASLGTLRWFDASSDS